MVGIVERISYSVVFAAMVIVVLYLVTLKGATPSDRASMARGRNPDAMRLSLLVSLRQPLLNSIACAPSR
jgi:hypothetical protein